MKYEEVRKDYNILESKYGKVHDYTGVFSDEGFENLLSNPTKTNVKKL